MEENINNSEAKNFNLEPIQEYQVSEPDTVPRSKPNNFLISFLSILLLISVLTAGFFAYQTQRLAKELNKDQISSTPTPLATLSPTASPDPTADWKVYPPTTTTGLPYSFKYPTGAEISEAQDLVYIKLGNSVIYHRFVAKQKDILKLLGNYSPFGVEKPISFSEKSSVSYGNLNGYKATTSDGNIYFFLGESDLNGILVFNFTSSDMVAPNTLNQIIATIKIDDSNQTACTMEAKICPDGSYVGRSGPKCEFAACPTAKP